ncbi:NHLP leader peptide family RiPP precursor [Aquimarina sp. ERC-38]|uniref:NHLP leader peptide family RiPP precursor n=1 Tax=Aquimarina sp. ERC-38 TaxID=2949996 RepID=UPI002245D8D2|nr:NHLP leader peptide family RiPP precursor [Aquimarina sp. ERC-38]UZO82186.1 NHLP leader peptide family RiPP precursor [Aquimarina sp. ERC-38]
MNLVELQKKADSNLQKIYAKAWENEEFKQSLINDPIATLNRITKGEFNPEGVKIQVNDQTDTSTLYLNIPADPKELVADFDMELTEEDLEVIAGGVVIDIEGSYLWGAIEIDIHLEW